MGKKFFDKILDLMGVYDEEAGDGQWQSSPVEIETAREVKETRGVKEEPKRGRLVSIPSQGQRQFRLVVFEPCSFEEVQEMAGHLKERRPVIVRLEWVEREVAKRIVDFMSGATYALEGTTQRLGDTLFLFAPSGVIVDWDGSMIGKGMGLNE